MTIFASKAALMALGLEAVTPSNAHMYQDCCICKDPLHINIHTAVSPSDAHHPAVRIIACGHMHGKECLEAWLDAGNSCPTCKRMLFDKSGHAVNQADINSVMHSLGRLVGEASIISSFARLVGKQELERAQLRHTHEEELQKARINEARSRQDDLIDDDDWLESGGEEDFDMDEEDGDGDFVLDEEDQDPQSATV
ncbi:hypothetical protein EKO04_001313 [Ascochyta lentis]|uniref:RING-type domain-containing protein n=1 Tax=Ascochyta lentis TaxID=205686 RepID=A0A8H7MLK9_9PLEO|nr:hypothetical protein EKO04_001313 [Ascochyta lentis]